MERSLLRRPLPPSETYKLPFDEALDATNRCVSSIDKMKSSGSLQRPILNVPTNTPYTSSYTHRVHHHCREIDIHPLFPKGPPLLPPGKILSQADGYSSTFFDRDAGEDIIVDPPPEFTLNDFLLSAQSNKNVSKTTQVTVSRENYLKLTSWFSTQKPTQSTISIWLANIDIPEPEKRVPEQQLFLEFHALLREISTEGLSIEEKDNHKKEQEKKFEEAEQKMPQEHSKDEILIKSSISRFFCGEGRSQSPFELSPTQPLASPSEVAILSTIVNGGTHLSLKAHFLSEIPNITPILSTLAHLNLSYNNLQVFPTQIFELHQLVCLKLRSNPIKEIPSGIKKLTNLEFFSISFNLLSDLPQALFELPYLRDLDVSHNYIECISRDIARLRYLEKLNVESNELVGLPGTILSLSLADLKTDGNFFHPALWKENTKNQPQTLMEIICCRSMELRLYDEELVQDVLKSKASGSYCDECNKPIYGRGLRLIRSNGQDQVFGYKCLPLIFQVCSPECHKTLKSCHEIIWNSDCKITP